MLSQTATAAAAAAVILARRGGRSVPRALQSAAAYSTGTTPPSDAPAKAAAPAKSNKPSTNNNTATTSNTSSSSDAKANKDAAPQQQQQQKGAAQKPRGGNTELEGLLKTFSPSGEKQAAPAASGKAIKSAELSNLLSSFGQGKGGASLADLMSAPNQNQNQQNQNQQQPQQAGGPHSGDVVAQQQQQRPGRQGRDQQQQQRAAARQAAEEKAAKAVPRFPRADFPLSLSEGPRLNIFAKPVSPAAAAAANKADASLDAQLDALLKAHTDFAEELKQSKAKGGVAEYFTELVASQVAKNPFMTPEAKKKLVRDVSENVCKSL
eukprot:m.133020 g.133020  ORF g.133020 m.133020 type:complete len:322 (-) comp16502_c2_seq2:153-1118(-)